MLETTQNGTPEQYRAFFGERVNMSGDLLSLESMALLAFDFREIIDSISFPETFWTALNYLLNKLSDISIKAVNATENQIASATLLNLFGHVTTTETIEPHSDLTQKVEETHEELSVELGNTSMIYVAIMHQIKQLIIKFHEAQLLEIQSHEEDIEVEAYLKKGTLSSITSIENSFDQSTTVFSSIKNDRDKLRLEILKSLSSWLSFANGTVEILFSGHRAMSDGLQMS